MQEVTRDRLSAVSILQLPFMIRTDFEHPGAQITAPKCQLLHAKLQDIVRHGQSHSLLPSSKVDVPER